MNATFARNYVKQSTGNDVFVYSVSFANETEHESFKTTQGVQYRVDAKTGDVLWFSSRYHGEATALIITSNNKVVADTSAFAKAKSLAKQYGGDFGQELARASAQSLLAGLIKPTAQTAQVPATQSDDLPY
jgi:hypothetical protein